MTMSYAVPTSGSVLETVLVHFMLAVVFSVAAFISPLWWTRKSKLKSHTFVRDRTGFEPCHRLQIHIPNSLDSPLVSTHFLDQGHAL